MLVHWFSKINQIYNTKNPVYPGDAQTEWKLTSTKQQTRLARLKDYDSLNNCGTLLSGQFFHPAPRIFHSHFQGAANSQEVFNSGFETEFHPIFTLKKNSLAHLKTEIPSSWWTLGNGCGGDCCDCDGWAKVW